MRPNDFNFSMVLLICANIMTYDQGKQVHIMTSTLQYAIWLSRSRALYKGGLIFLIQQISYSYLKSQEISFKQWQHKLVAQQPDRILQPLEFLTQKQYLVSMSVKKLQVQQPLSLALWQLMPNGIFCGYTSFVPITLAMTAPFQLGIFFLSNSKLSHHCPALYLPLFHSCTSSYELRRVLFAQLIASNLFFPSHRTGPATCPIHVVYVILAIFYEYYIKVTPTQSSNSNKMHQSHQEINDSKN